MHGQLRAQDFVALDLTLQAVSDALRVRALAPGRFVQFRHRLQTVPSLNVHHWLARQAWCYTPPARPTVRTGTTAEKNQAGWARLFQRGIVDKRRGRLATNKTRVRQNLRQKSLVGSHPQ